MVMHRTLSRRGFLFRLSLAPKMLRPRGGQEVTVSEAIDRLLMWRRILDDASVERATVKSTPDGVELSGTVLAAEGGKPLGVDYRLLVDANWRSRSLDLVQDFDGERRSLVLIADAGARWRLNGRESPKLDGCVDIDLGLSPITNALPLNRLGIARAGAGEVLAAWVRFPQLTVEPARQRYERTGHSVYRYSSLTSGFTAAIHVDDLGFPIEYEGVWKRIAVGRVAPDIAAPTANDGFISALLADGLLRSSARRPECSDSWSAAGTLRSATSTRTEAFGRVMASGGSPGYSRAEPCRTSGSLLPGRSVGSRNRLAPPTTATGRRYADSTAPATNGRSCGSIPSLEPRTTCAEAAMATGSRSWVMKAGGRFVGDSSTSVPMPLRGRATA
jgi:hypothetical protein